MIKKYRIQKILAVLLLFTVSSIFASGESRNGTAGAQELLIPVGARGIALGGANVSNLSGVESIYYNPAGLGGMSGSVETMFSYMTYIADINLVYATVGINMYELGTIGVTLKSLDFGDIPETTTLRPEGTGSMFSPSYSVMGVTYANFLTENIKAGVSFNLVSETIMNTSASGVAIDAGIQYNRFAYIEGLQIGVVLKNFGPQMNYDGPDLIRTATDNSTLRGGQFYNIEAAGFELPSQMVLGMSYSNNLNESITSVVSTSFQNNNFANDEYKIAVEVGYEDMFFLRGGYSYVGEAQSNKDENIFGPTFGLGFNIQGGVNMHFDYAYRLTEYFDDSQIFALKILF